VVSPNDDGAASPADAALATWWASPGAHADIRSVTIRGRRAEVVVATDQSDIHHLDYVYCVQGTDQRWRVAASGSGPTHRWDDPAHLDWGE
jgi:hypothetical protein